MTTINVCMMHCIHDVILGLNLLAKSYVNMIH